MNIKKVQKAIDKAFKRLSKLSDEEFKELIEKTPDKWGKLLARGGFFDPAGKHLSDKERLEKFPDLHHKKSINISFNYPSDLFNYCLDNIDHEILSYKKVVLENIDSNSIHDNTMKRLMFEEYNLPSAFLCKKVNNLSDEIMLDMHKIKSYSRIYSKGSNPEKLTSSISEEEQEIQIEELGWTKAA